MTQDVSAEQLVYTSCRHAIGGGSGFQVQSHSPGVTAGDLMTIAQRSRYVRPGNRGPGDDSDATRHPIGFRWYPLPSGAWAMTRVNYVGADYTGRPGNFFGHSLVFSAANVALVDPVALLDWKGWRNGLAPDEDRSPTVAPLPAVGIASSQPSGLREFAGLPDARARAEQIVVALFDAIDRGLKLVIKTGPADNNRWLRAIGRMLPRSAIGAIEFSSLESSLQQAPLLSLTVEGSDIDVRHGDRGDFIGLDLTAPLRPLEGPASAMKVSGHAYAAALTRILFDRPELIQAFMAHLDAFSGGAIGADLSAAAQLFLQAERVDTGTAAGADVPDLVRVALRKRDPRFAAIIASLLDPMRAQLRDDSGADQLLLAEAAGFAAQNGSDADRCTGSAADAWFRAWLAAVRSGPDALDEVTDAGAALASTLGATFSRGVVAALLRDDRAQASAAMEHAPIEGAARLLRFTIDLLADQGLSDPIGDSEAVPKLVEAVMRAGDAKQRLRAALDVVPTLEEKALLLQLAAFYGDGPARGARLADLAEIAAGTIDALAPAPARDFRLQLPPHLIVAEWSLRLSTGKAVESYRTYAPQFLSARVLALLAPDDRTSMYRALALAVERGGDPKDLLAIVEQLVREDQFAQLETHDQERLLGRAAQAIDFEKEETADRVSTLLQEARRLRLESVFCRAQLSLALRDMDRGGIVEPETIGRALSALPARDRAIVRDRLTYHALHDLGAENGGALFAQFTSGSDTLYFTGEDMNHALKRLGETGDAPAMLALLEWWFASPQAAQRFARPLWEDTFHRLIQACVAIDKQSGKVIARRFLGSGDERALPNRDYHERWQDAYRRKSASPLDRTRAVVGGIARLFPRKSSDED